MRSGQCNGSFFNHPTLFAHGLEGSLGGGGDFAEKQQMAASFIREMDLFFSDRGDAAEKAQMTEELYESNDEEKDCTHSLLFNHHKCPATY
jgi:hypothetical protein